MIIHTEKSVNGTNVPKKRSNTIKTENTMFKYINISLSCIRRTLLLIGIIVGLTVVFPSLQSCQPEDVLPANERNTETGSGTGSGSGSTGDDGKPIIQGGDTTQRIAPNKVWLDLESLPPLPQNSKTNQ